MTENSHTGRLYGYARVSTIEQDVAIQREALTKAGCTVIREEKISGTTINRPELLTLLQFLRRGDTLVVLRVDRLARDTHDLLTIVKDLESRGVALMIIGQNIDTRTATGKAFLSMLAVFAEFETNIRKERQLAGIEQAKAKGVYCGRRQSISRDTVRQLTDQGWAVAAIADALKVSRQSVHNVQVELGLRVAPPHLRPLTLPAERAT